MPVAPLTAAQRLHLEVYGYVVVERALSAEFTAELRDALYSIEAHFRREGSLPPGVTADFSTTREFFRIDNLPQVDPCFLRYVTDPLMVALAEEAVGGPVRLEQSDAHIRRPTEDPADQSYLFHRGGYAGMAMTAKGLYHYPFVKTLTNLDDLGPDDGGTAVIAGTHKLVDVDYDAVMRAVAERPDLIHSVVAPAGSTLLFFESLLHSNGIIRSGRDRPLIVAGYTPTMFQAWPGYDLDPEFVATVDEQHQAMLDGRQRWNWQPAFRSLAEFD